MNAASRQLHDDEKIEGDEAVLRPNFDRSEIHGSQHVPMRLEKGMPRRLSPPLRRRLDAMFLQDVGHAGRGDLMTYVSQSALNPIITPGGILLGNTNHQIANLLGKRWASGLLPPTVAVVPLSSYQEPMPAQDGVGSEQSADLVEELAAKDFPFDSQPAALVIVE
jgi:hypothetical protein